MRRLALLALLALVAVTSCRRAGGGRRPGKSFGEVAGEVVREVVGHELTKPGSRDSDDTVLWINTCTQTVKTAAKMTQVLAKVCEGEFDKETGDAKWEEGYDTFERTLRIAETIPDRVLDGLHPEMRHQYKTNFIGGLRVLVAARDPSDELISERERGGEKLYRFFAWAQKAAKTQQQGSR